MRRVALISFLGLCAFAGGWVAGNPGHLFHSSVWAQLGSSTPPRTHEGIALGERFEWVARKVSPAVVAIEASKPAPPSRDGTPPRKKAIEESGSGVLVKFEGQRDVFVITNNHVVSDAGTNQITVNLADGKILKPSKVWTDPESDIALLRMDNAGNLPIAPLGDSDRMRVGHMVLAVGSPFGLNQTVTHGIISARERGQVSLGGTIRIKDFLQTDAAINPGSSGGPLINMDGEVIGINTAIASHSGSNSGVAFSIPINLVKRVAGQLLQKGSVSRGYLGLQLAGSFDPNEALRLGLDRAQGALVETVYPDTPAASAGLRGSDVVLRVDGIVIRHENHFINMVSAMEPGRKITLEVWRDRKTITLTATVGDWSRGQSQLRSDP